jgi:D-alanyl-D-alanine carboxypeptidase
MVSQRFVILPVVAVVLLLAASSGNAFEPAKMQVSIDDIAARVREGRPLTPRSDIVSPRTGVKRASLPRTETVSQPKPPAPWEQPLAKPSEKGAVAVTPTPAAEISSSTSLSVRRGLAAIPRDARRPHQISPAARMERNSAPRAFAAAARTGSTLRRPAVRAKAIYCVDCSCHKVMLAENVAEPLPIASLTKLLTAMVVIDEMKLDQSVEVPPDIVEVPRHRVGLRPGDLLTVRDLLHGMLIESGNDCAELLARAYPKGGMVGFMAAMNKKAVDCGAKSAQMLTPSGLDLSVTVGKKNGRALEVKHPNLAAAQDVAKIAEKAFTYPLIREITSQKTYVMRTLNPTPRDYRLASNIKLLYGNLPIAGAKTGYTDKAGRCIVALFKDAKAEHMVIVLNTPKHFKAAERLYHWAKQQM